mgnify:FL=1
MKKIFLLLTTFIMVLCCMSFVGCVNSSGNGCHNDSTNGNTPTETKTLTLSFKNGVISWTADSSATGYEFSLDGTDYKTEGIEEKGSSVSLDVSSYLTEPKKYTVNVRAVYTGKKGDVASKEINVAKLATPNKPTISLDDETHYYSIVWEEVENAYRYGVSVNGGKFVTYAKNSFSPSATGDYSIVVKCLSYSKGDNYYLESETSEASETLSVIEGPVVMTYGINTISWNMSEEIDSYNVYVDGKLAKENVTSPLNMVTGDNPAITATGEYNIQLEAVKGSTSTWSNILEEFGTSNINANEIYSFDNRKWNLSNVQATGGIGYEISNEKYHGDSGYSLKITKAQQYNMVKYCADGINDIDFSKITKITYWVYVETAGDYEGETVPVSALPQVRYEALQYNNFTQSYPGTNVDAVPIGEWTKIEVPCRVYHEQVLIFTMATGAVLYGDNNIDGYVMYIDDICYEIDDYVVPDGTEYVSKFSNRGGWYDGGAYTELDFGEENANKTIVNLAFEVCGTASYNYSCPIGFVAFDQPTGKGENVIGWLSMDRALIADTNAWRKVTFHNLMLNEEGKIYITATLCPSPVTEDFVPFKIFFKLLEDDCLIETAENFLALTLRDEYKVDKTIAGVPYDYEIDVSSNTFVEVWSSMDGGATKNHNFIKTDISGMSYTYTVTKADGTAAEQHTIKRYADDQRYVFFTYATDEYYTLNIRVMNSHGGVDNKYVKINVDQSGNQSAVWFDMFEVSEGIYNAYIHAAGGNTAGLTYSVGLENSRYGHDRVLTLSNISSDAKILFSAESQSQAWFDGGKPQYYTLNITYYINSNGNKLTDYEIYNLIPKTYGSSWDCAGYTYETDKWITATYVYNKTVDGERVPLTHDTWVAMTDGKGIVLSNVTSYAGIEVYVSDISFGKTLPEYTPAAYELFKDNFIELEIASEWASKEDGIDYEIEAAAGKRIVLYHTDTDGTNYASDIVKSVGVNSSIDKVQYTIKNNSDALVAVANRQYSEKYYYLQTDASVEYYLLTIYCENDVGAYDEKIVKIVVNADETCALQTSTMTYEGTTQQGYYALPAHISGVTCGSEIGAEYGFGTMIKLSEIKEDAKALCGNDLINGKTYNTVKMWVYIDSAEHELTAEQIQGLTPKFFGDGWTCTSGYPTETDKWVELTFVHDTVVTHDTWLGFTDGKGFVLSNTTGHNDIVVYIGDVSISTVTE